ncbi:MAG TPA: MOSC domain-containing protein [Gemmataceae bacterium]|nr:MOSC domain-containing protein [Gemmataceae bacterium]
MSVIGTIDSLWRYPVKSMRGEELHEAFVGFAGIYGDRLFAIRSSAAVKGFPYLTAREQRRMLQYQPRFRFPDKAARPINLTEAESLAPGVTPAFADAPDLMMDVETPTGEVLAIDDARLLRDLGENVSGAPSLSLVRSDRALTDCRPISLLSMQSVQQLGNELGQVVDPRSFRENIYLNLSAAGFTEDSYVGKSLLLGSRVKVSILERDPRCVMISMHPETGESKPEVLRQVAQAHQGMTGIYAAVLVEGIVRKGDPVRLLSA